MPAGLLTLPLRIGVRTVSVALGVTERAAGLAWGIVESVVPGRDTGSSRRQTERPFPRDAEPAGTGDGNGRADEVARDPRAEFELGDPRFEPRVEPPDPVLRDVEPEPAPATAPPRGGHVDTEETLVESFAEPGAADGAGAQVRIDPPWVGYAEQTAESIIERVGSSSPEVLAAIELYEAAHKQRSTVLSAVERGLRAAG